MNSSFANEDKINRRLKNCEAWINPRDATTLGIAEGTLLQLENMVGRIALTVGQSETVPRGVILAPKGRWPKGSSSGANVNSSGVLPNGLGRQWVKSATLGRGLPINVAG